MNLGEIHVLADARISKLLGSKVFFDVSITAKVSVNLADSFSRLCNCSDNGAGTCNSITCSVYAVNRCLVTVTYCDPSSVQLKSELISDIRIG